MNDQLGRQVARGAVIKLLGGVPVNILALVLTLISARVLVPSEYGVYSLALAIYGLSDILTNPAVATYLIRNPDATDRSIDAAWTLSALRGVLLCAIMFGVAPLLSAAFDGGQQVTLLLRIMSMGFLAQGLKNLHVVRFHQQLDMSRVLLVDSLGTALASILGITLLFLTRNVYSLAIATAAGPWLNALFSLIFARKPSFSLDVAEWSSIWRFTRFLLLNSLIHYALLNLDDLMIAKLSSKAALGLYTLSYAMVNAVVLFLVRPLGEIMLPALSRLQREPERLADACIGAVSVLAAVSWGVTSLAWIVSSDLFILVSPSKEWSAAAPVFRALLPFVLVRGVNNALGAMVLAAGHPKYLTQVSGAQLLLMIPIGLLGYKNAGYLGLVVAITVLNALSMLALTWITPRLAPVTTLKLLTTIVSPFPAALAAGTTAWLVSEGIQSSLVLRVTCATVAAVAVFTASWELTCRTRAGVLAQAVSVSSLVGLARSRRGENMT